MGLVQSGNTRYRVNRISSETIRELQQSLGLSRLTASLLAGRGVDSVEAARRFLAPDLDDEWLDPYEIPGMREVAERVAAAMFAEQRIVVFGDFDADGVTSTSIIMLALTRLGADITPIIPWRLTEGYGLSKAACGRIIDLHPDLVVTVDNGISAATEVEMLRAEGIDVVVTDHHEPGDLVPVGIPIANPKLEPGNRGADLAGVGVALKLVAAVGGMFGQPDLWRSFTDIATIGTIGDQMPLTPENRALVSDGLKRMAVEPRPAIRAFLDSRRDPTAPIVSDDLSFTLIPRINSAGRVGDASLAYRFLTAPDLEQATQLLVDLEVANTARREAETHGSSIAMELSETAYEGGRSLVLASEGFHEGVKGIIASRMVSRFGVPAIIFRVTEDGVAVGSGRTAGQIDLFEAVRSCSDLLLRYGGHPAAVGVSLPVESLPEFRARLESYLEGFPESEFTSVTDVDVEVALDEVTVDTIDELSSLEPFGNGNRRPLLVTRFAHLEGGRAVGADSRHFSCMIADGISKLRAICFNPGDVDALVSLDGMVDVVFEPQVNEFRGHRQAQAQIHEVLPMGSVMGPTGQVDSGTGATGAVDAGSGAGGDPATDITPEEDLPTFLDHLLETAETSLDRGDYASITDCDSFHTKVAGVTFEGRQETLAMLPTPSPLELRREPDNAFDPAATAVWSSMGQIGYLNARLSARIAPAMDGGAAYAASLDEVTGGDEGRSLGANITVYKVDALEERENRRRQLVEVRESWAGSTGADLADAVRTTLIGENQLHDAQREALAALSKGDNVLAIMATGRGKSLIFQMHAILCALADGRASVFIYPLRALVADQAYHLSRTLEPFGLGAAVLTGETPLPERESIFSDLAEGRIACILTTPEFFTIHLDGFAASKRVGFVAVDEAHHIADTHRSAYGSVGAALERLGSPTVLAVTATAGTAVAGRIREQLAISKMICDDTCRDNLVLEDHRDAGDGQLALAHIVASGGKTVAYVNSRERTVDLARMLRHRLPDLRSSVAFYNAGLDRETRNRLEAGFRSGELRCIIATSAFGEGINIPDIRNVVLYHMPFSLTEFNQMAGRGGRDGAHAEIHLLFGNRDAGLNERILEGMAPSRDDLVLLWRTLKMAQREGGEEITLSNSDIAGVCASIDPRSGITDSGVSTGVSIFRELGLVDSFGYGSARTLVIRPDAGKVDLESSTRYREGMGQLDEFRTFREWVLGASPDELLSAFNHPILPG